jgi:hypothetical protein
MSELGAVLALPAAPDELPGHHQQQAQQRRRESWMRDQADGHGERRCDRAGDGRGPDARQPASADLVGCGPNGAAESLPPASFAAPWACV